MRGAVVCSPAVQQEFHLGSVGDDTPVQPLAHSAGHSGVRFSRDRFDGRKSWICQVLEIFLNISVMNHRDLEC